MKSPCDIVAERIALGEPLGDRAEHAATCASCRRLAALPTEIGATRSDADPGLGFSARVAAGAQQRVAVRRRRRIAIGVASSMAASVMGVVLMTRTPDASHVAEPTPPAPATDPHKPDPWKDPQPGADDDVKALLRMATTESSSHRFKASWRSIERPLAPYRALVKGLLDDVP